MDNRNLNFTCHLRDIYYSPFLIHASPSKLRMPRDQREIAIIIMGSQPYRWTIIMCYSSSYVTLFANPSYSVWSYGEVFTARTFWYQGQDCKPGSISNPCSEGLRYHYNPHLTILKMDRSDSKKENVWNRCMELVNLCNVLIFPAWHIMEPCF